MAYRRRYFAPLTITTAALGTGMVTEEKLATGAVSSRAVLDRAIVADDIADAAIRARHLGPDIPSIGIIPDNSITTPKIVNDAVTALKIAAGAIHSSSQLGSKVVTRAKIDDRAVDTDQLEDASVNHDKLGLGAVGTPNLVDEAVTGPKLAPGVGRYVPRSAGATADFNEPDFPIEGAWQVDGLDLSAIVPAGAIAVHLAVEITGNTFEKEFRLRGNATTKAGNHMKLGVDHTASFVIPTEHAVLNLDTDRKLDYYRDLDLVDIWVWVLGWYV